MKNIGTLDRTLRVILAIVLFGLVFVLHGYAKWFCLLGFIPLATAITGVCPLYSFLHISTKKE